MAVLVVILAAIVAPIVSAPPEINTQSQLIPGTPEAGLYHIFLQPRDWAELTAAQLSTLNSQL